MFTEPKIVTSEDLNQRSYVTFYSNNKRIREYNGNSINLSINPNRADSISVRNKLLIRLQYELHKALVSGKYLANKIEPVIEKELSVEDLLKQALDKKLNSDLSKTYKRNLRLVYEQFITSLSTDERHSPIASITISRVEQFLTRYNSSGTYYMDRRRDLGVLFSAVGRIIDQQILTIKKTEPRRMKAKLHKAYDKEQIKPILAYLKTNNFNLYICCLLTYGAWLRPHEEVRLLKKEHFHNDFTEIHLSGTENKGGKVRVVYLPEYIKVEIAPILDRLDRTDNLFSCNPKPFNDHYFNTQWKRCWDKMFALGLIHKNQTIYSFRHTAAIQVFNKSKDVYLLQKLLGHSSILVTLKYLRSLGEFNSDELRDAAPTLD